MKLRRPRRAVGWAFAGFVLLSCASPFFLVPPASPSQPAADPALLVTIIAQTAAAAQTSTQLFLPTASLTPTSTQTRLPTWTPPPVTSTPTFLLLFPSSTLPSATFTLPAASGGGPAGPISSGVTNTLTSREEFLTKFPKKPREWDCRITEKGPPRGTLITPRKDFYVSWLILNNGTKTWTNNGVDFVYTGGYRSAGRPIQDLPVTIAPGQSIKLKVLLTAPRTSGLYNVYWSLKVGNTLFCHMKNTFEVR